MRFSQGFVRLFLKSAVRFLDGCSYPFVLHSLRREERTPPSRPISASAARRQSGNRSWCPGALCGHRAQPASHRQLAALSALARFPIFEREGLRTRVYALRLAWFSGGELRQKLKERFCAHRGDTSAGPENSYEAIRTAATRNLLFVEFDVMFVNGAFYTGHPPSEPIDELGRILTLFEGNTTFPKIDLKLGSCEDFRKPIDTLLSLIREQFELDFVLLNIGGLGREAAMEAQHYLAAQIREEDHIGLNIDLHNYRAYNECIDEDIHNHVVSLGDVVYTISPEIHKEDHELIGKFAQDHGIRHVCFWLFGPPSEPNPSVSEVTLLKALELEKRYRIAVYFDMDQRYVTP